MCVINNVTVNYVNSDIEGGTSLTQACGTCGGESGDDNGGQCICYMDDITVNSFNSNVEGGVDLTQTCGQCFQEIDGVWTEVSCKTGGLISPDDGSAEQPSDEPEERPWWKKKWTVIMIVIVVLAGVLFLGFWYSKMHNSKVNAEMAADVAPFDDYYYY